MTLPETLNLGFIPLIDCAPLVAASAKGFAAQEGIDLRLVRESSWANIRDRVIVRHFHGAHMLAPMTVAASLGAGQMHVPMVAPITLGLNGNAITVSARVWREMADHGAAPGGPAARQGTAIARVIAARAARGEPPLTFAVVFPFSCQNYELRWWLASAGVDPERDVRIVVLPPPFLVDALRSGQVDGFCVAAPWNTLAVDAGIGCIAVFCCDLWPRAPEKVLGLRRDWAEEDPARLSALVRAVYAAARWCDDPANHEELAQIMAEPRHVGVPAATLLAALQGRLAPSQGVNPVRRPDYVLFHRDGASVPRPAAHGGWILAQMRLWGQIAPADGQLAAALATFRADLHAAAVGEEPPPLPAKAPSREAASFFGTPLEEEAAVRDYLGSWASLPGVAAG